MKNNNIIKKYYKSNYNYNINGSRGLAVILVFIFHLNLNYFSGGYIGVDIFFVISGYVITQSLLNIFKKEKNFIHTTKIFFKKRIARIVPAIVVLSFVSVVVFKQIFIEKHYISFLQSVFFSNFFLSNFFFWNESGYFGLENLFKPLLHTWSLSVEIQVYLLVPLLLFFLLRNKYLLFYSASMLIIFLSVFLGEVFINRPFVYFFPFFRFHEFLLGIFIFCYLNSISNKKLNYKFSYLGVILIIISSVYLNETKNFPGINSLLPIVGILMIIISEDKKNILLCNNITQYLGNISYSLYLYHWPVIVAFKYITLKTFFNFYDVVSICLITLILSHLSYKYVELSFKSLEVKKKITFLIIFIFVVTSFYSLTFSKQNQIEINENDFLKNEIIIRDTYLNKINKDTFSKNKIFVIGDSHAQDLFISLSHDNLYLKKYSKTYLPLDDSCFKYVGKKTIVMKIENFIATNINMAGQSYCNSQIKGFLEASKNIKNSNILISSRWSVDTLGYVEKIIKLLLKDGNNLILVNRRPRFFDVPSLHDIKSSFNQKTLNELAYNLKDKNINRINYLIKSIVTNNNLKHLDLMSIICIDKENKCFVINDDNLLFIDNDHFSMFGSKFFSSKISKKLIKLTKD